MLSNATSYGCYTLGMKRYIPWLAAAAIIIVISGTIYATVQQAQRSAANTPQIQLAEDTAVLLNHGAEPKNIVLGSVDMRASLAPFTVIYDKAGHVVKGSGFLDQKVPEVPIGILKAAEGHEYNAVTWQPEENVRIATVTVAANQYYVMSGRSLREVEKNEDATLRLTLFGGVFSILILAVSCFICSPMISKFTYLRV